MVSTRTTSMQLIVAILATIFACAYAGFGPSADGEWTENDFVAYVVVASVAAAILVLAILLYCQLRYFMRVGKIEDEANQKTKQALAKQEAELKSQQVAAQKEKVRRDIAEQKAKQQQQKQQKIK